MKILFVTGLLLIGIAACSPYRITQNKADPSATWSAYRSYAFVDTARIDPAPGGSYQAAMTELKRAVTAELRNRGYQPTPNNPDLLVNIGAVVKEKTQTRQTTLREAPLYTGQRRYSWRSQEVPTETYNEGTINLHIIDAQQQVLLWDVAVASVLKNGALSQQTASEAVARAFEKFPGKSQR